jgi:hypothetical protein
MAPLPVIPDVIRTGFKFASAQGTSVNVLHWRVATPPSFGALALNFSAKAAASASTTPVRNPFAALSEFMVLSGIDVIDLSSTTSGTETQAMDEPNLSGTSNGDEIPASAVIVTISTGLRGPRHRGRVFIGPTCENSSAGGFYVDRAALQTNWDAWAQRMAEDDPLGAYVLGVASYAHSDFSDFSLLTVRSAFGTIRRRQDRRRG